MNTFSKTFVALMIVSMAVASGLAFAHEATQPEPQEQQAGHKHGKKHKTHKKHAAKAEDKKSDTAPEPTGTPTSANH